MYATARYRAPTTLKELMSDFNRPFPNKIADFKDKKFAYSHTNHLLTGIVQGPHGWRRGVGDTSKIYHSNLPSRKCPGCAKILAFY